MTWFVRTCLPGEILMVLLCTTFHNCRYRSSRSTVDCGVQINSCMRVHLYTYSLLVLDWLNALSIVIAPLGCQGQKIKC